MEFGRLDALPVRRWIPKANAMVEGGWPELVPRTVWEE